MKCYVPVGTLEWKWLKSALQKGNKTKKERG